MEVSHLYFRSKLEYSSLTVDRMSKTIFLVVSIINMILNSI